MEHAALSRTRAQARPAVPNEDQDAGDADSLMFPHEPGLPALNTQARLALRHAQGEAWRGRQQCVDTDHLLLGLLCEPGSVGVAILNHLDVKGENIRRALGRVADTHEKVPAPLRSAPPREQHALPLTSRARAALVLAGQEAHRFDKAAVGTDHLLLGLALMGTGAAAVALLREGATVDSIRAEVLKRCVRG